MTKQEEIRDLLKFRIDNDINEFLRPCVNKDKYKERAEIVSNLLLEKYIELSKITLMDATEREFLFYKAYLFNKLNEVTYEAKK